MVARRNVIGAFEAKTRLSELLREVERGASFVIRRRGKDVAKLVPPDRGEGAVNPAQLVPLFRQIRRRVSGRGGIKELIESGRRR